MNGYTLSTFLLAFNEVIRRNKKLYMVNEETVSLFFEWYHKNFKGASFRLKITLEEI